MNNIKLNHDAVNLWFKNHGDYTHSVNYNLNENSVVMDFGGYTGVWAQRIIDKYNPYVYIIEPVPALYQQLVNKFKNNNKVKVLNVGVSNKDEEVVLYLNNDGTSRHIQGGQTITVVMNSIETILKSFNLTHVNLLQINIEGDEYSLLEYMFKNNIVEKFENIQIQFHLGIDGDIQRRDMIRDNFVSLGYILNFDYPFVWESWKKSSTST